MKPWGTYWGRELGERCVPVSTKSWFYYCLHLSLSVDIQIQWICCPVKLHDILFVVLCYSENWLLLTSRFWLHQEDLHGSQSPSQLLYALLMNLSKRSSENPQVKAVWLALLDWQTKPKPKYNRIKPLLICLFRAAQQFEYTNPILISTVNIW